MPLAAELIGAAAGLIVIGSLGFWFVQWLTRSAPVDETNALLRQIVKNTTPLGVTPPSIEALAEPANDRTRRLLREAIDLQNQNREEEAIQRLLTAYDMDLPAKAKAELHLLAGIGYARLSRLIEAESNYRQALAAAEQAGDEKLRAAAIGSLGIVFSDRGDLDNAEEQLKKALEIYEAMGDRLSQARALGGPWRRVRALRRLRQGRREYP
jgi:tetratricopeptide (TPR) repeat protein